MNIEEIITSGLLELYVCGSLTDQEREDIEVAIAKSPLLKKEVEIIEASLLTLAENVSPPLSSNVWTYIMTAIGSSRSKNNTTKFNWAEMSGWAAAILLLGGLFWAMNLFTNLEQKATITSTEKMELETELQRTEEALINTENTLAILRNDAYQTIQLPGTETIAPGASVKIFYNKEEGIAYIDTKSLPIPPRGNVYQVWSLVMEPLTPSSMGLLVATNAVQPNFYRFDSFPRAEGFGITIEPAGGSTTPTLSQLVVLGQVSQP